MRDRRVALAQIAPRLGDLDANFESHRRALERARADGAGLIVFPELSLTGYHLADQVPEVALAVDDPRLVELSREAGDLDVVLGLVEESPGHRFYNAAAWLSDGRVRHVHRKVHLPTYGMFQEGREFARGETLRAFDAGGGRAGLLICEDLWHPISAWLLAQQGAQVIYALSNGPTRGARPGVGITSIEVWRRLLSVTAQFQTTWLVYVNRVGYEDGLSFGGGSMVVDPFGTVVAELPALEEEIRTVTLEDGPLRRARTCYPLLRDADTELLYRELGRFRQRRFDLPDDDAEPSDDA